MAQQELFKMAANDEEQYHTLLSYYRSKIGEFDKERMEWLAKIEEIRISHEDKHRLEWELLKRKEEIAELQRTLSESKLMLFEERQLCLKLQRDNDQLKLKELEDRKRIQELLIMTGSVEEQVVLQRDVRPQTTQKYGTNEFSLKNQTTKPAPQGPKTVIKTIYLPNEQLNSVAIENENLKRQIEEAYQLLSQQHAALKEEMENIREDCRLRVRADEQQLQTLQERLQRMEKHNIDLNKDFYVARQRFTERERQLQEESDIVRQRNANLIAKVQDIEQHNNKENKAAINLLEKRSEEYNRKFRNEAARKEESLQILKEQYSQVQQIYIQKTRTLEENLARLIEKYQNLEKRRVLEIEGFKTDIRRLNQRLKEYDAKVAAQRQSSMTPEEIQKYQFEAQQLKEETLKQTQNIYGDPARTKKKLKPASSAPRTQKKKDGQSKQRRPSPKAEQSNDHLNDIAEEEYQSSIALNELEEIQQQIDELERRMDASRKQ